VSVIEVNAPSLRYRVHVGRGLLGSVGRITREATGGERVCVISDSNVAPLYGQAVTESLEGAGYEPALLTFAAGERNKRLPTLEGLLEQVAETGLTRDDVVVALGGGVTGDMAGLVAALYLRGIRVVQVPTSLLAMVDSSVGGKTAVDLRAGKNLAGAFLQPSAVIADVDCLDTLAHGLLSDGCGEVIKHGVLADPELFRDVAAHPVNAPGYDRDHLVGVVARNVAIKRDVVAADERERGARQTLNLGHTIGHAIEAASGFSLGHGSSVAAGLCCMSWAAARLGWCATEVAEDVCACVAAHGLPVDTSVPHETLVRYATHDKKRHGDGVNVIVPVRIGHVEVRHVSLREFEDIVRLGCDRTTTRTPRTTRP